MARSKEKRHHRRRREERSSSSGTNDSPRVTSHSRVVPESSEFRVKGKLHHGGTRHRRKSEAVETRSMADAKIKLNENRHRILREMGIDEKCDKTSIMSVSSNAEILRETVIEHKIQIPRKTLVKNTVMREVSVEEVELVSEEIMEVERVPQKIVTVGRPSELPHGFPTERIEEEIIEVPEVIVKKNFIEKKVPKVVERIIEVADDTVHCIPKEVEVTDLEYIDEVVQLEEEYVQYVDVEVPEIVEVPNYIEIAEEKHVTKDVLNEIAHYEPKLVELEHVIEYECPTLVPVYRDETYTINIPRIIQVPVYEDLLPEHNLETLHILKERFDEMASMHDPVAMCFAEDYAVQAQENFLSIRVPHAEVEHPSIPHHDCEIPQHEPHVRVPTGLSTAATSVSGHVPPGVHSSTTSSVSTFHPTPNTKATKGCCARPKTQAPLSTQPPKSHKSTRSHVSHITGGPSQPPPSSSQPKPVTRVPRGFSQTGVSTIPSTLHHISNRHTNVSHRTPPPPPPEPSDFTPKITETFVGQRVVKRSVDTTYVQQFVTNADPLHRHPPSHIIQAASAPVGLPVSSLDEGRLASELRDQVHVQAMSVPSNASHASGSHAFSNRGTENASLYHEGAAARSGQVPRLDKNGGLLVHPPTPMSSQPVSPGQ